MKICIDPGHGNWSRAPGKYDTGTTFEGYQEATIAMEWANELRGVLLARGHVVIRTRRDAEDPAPVGRRDDVARAYKCERMLSIHCNDAEGVARASGTEVFYRGADDLAMARALSAGVARALGLPDRGAKTEGASQHSRLAVMEFDKCWLLELGFLDHPKDRAAMLDAGKRKACCEVLADLLTAG